MSHAWQFILVWNLFLWAERVPGLLACLWGCGVQAPPLLTPALGLPVCPLTAQIPGQSVGPQVGVSHFLAPG